MLSAQIADVIGQDGEKLATVVYGHGARLWRLNLGWRRRKEKDQTGFVLDVERGFWAKSEVVQDDPDDPMSPKTERVVPYVEDTRNCIVLEPGHSLDLPRMASLESALKAAIQAQFQLEDRELATEALPSSEDRRKILLYEAAEGGAGVLRRLVEDPQALPEVARLALEIAHFDPTTLEDQHRAEGATEDCEAACYDCLLSYYNQRDHRFLDRHLLPEILGPWVEASVKRSSTARPREQQLAYLGRQCDSELERRWLDFIDRLQLALPSHAQEIIPACHVKPDFLYREKGVAVFVDGPPHDTPEQQRTDADQQDVLEDAGFTVIRFHHQADWEQIVRKNPDVFGPPIDVSGEQKDDR
jgi:very-short-patch-repair endonuclease